jgi:4-hydroxy-tetrahydrodipicolinate synthase
MTQQKKCWHGAHTALVTPMHTDGQVDHVALKNLVERQIEAGIAGLIACGTTAEAATLTETERLDVIRTVVSQAGGRVPVMAGVGTQSTSTTIAALQHAQAAGVQAVLVVTPYYNKPTQAGLEAHYRAIADASALPVMMYNVPSRTGCDLAPETVRVLAQHPRLFGIKDATGDLNRIDALRGRVPSTFVQLSGDDNTACAFTLMGGHGVASVLSNILPKQMVALIDAARQGNLPTAHSVQGALAPLFDAMGYETNPIPIKTALAIQGHITEAFRLPLCTMQPTLRSQLSRVLHAAGVTSDSD